MTHSRLDTPNATFTQTEIVLDRGGAFLVNLPGKLVRPDVSLILDIYDLTAPVHPAGHMGWWRYDPDQMGQQVVGRLSRTEDGFLYPVIEGTDVVDEWRNETPPASQLFELQIVLRSTITHAILSIHRIPVVRSDRALTSFRSSFDRNYQSPRYAPYRYVFSVDRTVHIVSKSIFQRDAVGNLCLGLYRMLRQHRASVNIYADNFDLALNDVIDLRAELPYRVAGDDVVIYFFSTYDESLTEVTGLKCRYKIAYFHGVTEPRLLQVFDPGLSAICAKAIRQIPLLAQFDRLTANSHTNAAVLREAFATADCTANGPIAVLAPTILGDYRPTSSPDAKAGTGSSSFLYVGRITAHKRIEDIMRLLSEYRKLDPSARCVFVGLSDCQAYHDYLHWVQTKQLNLPEDAVSWLGSISDEQLNCAYDAASVYLSMSEDEGFCLPVLEAMSRGVLVFAYDQPAVRETLGSTGVLFSEKSFEHLSRQLHLLLAEPDVCQKIVDAQHERAHALMVNLDGREYLEILTQPWRKGDMADGTGT